MMKKMLAVLTAAAMLVCFTGCGDTASEQPGDMLTLEEYMGVVGVQEQQTEESGTQSDLSFEMVYSLGNNDALNTFVEEVSLQQPTSYTRTIAGEGYDASLTVRYDVTSVSIELIETVNGQTNVQTIDNVGLSVPLFCELYMTEDGQIDMNSYLTAVYQSGLYGWYSVNPSIFTQCVHYLIATLPTGEQLLVDYYYNEQLSEQLEQLYASQG